MGAEMETITEQTGNKLNWGPVSALFVTTAAYLASQLILVLPISILGIVNHGQDINNLLDTNPWIELAFGGLSATTIIAVLGFFLKKRHSSIKSLGFRRIKLSDMGWLVLGVIAYFILLVITITLASKIPGYNADQAQNIGYANAAGWQLGLAFIGLVILPPLAEEMLFRGFLYRGLAAKWKPLIIIIIGAIIAIIFAIYSKYVDSLIVAGFTLVAAALGRLNKKIGAALVASGLFALVHFQWNVAVDVFILSLIMIALLEKTKNLWVCVCLHALKNGLAFLTLFVFVSH